MLPEIITGLSGLITTVKGLNSANNFRIELQNETQKVELEGTLLGAKVELLGQKNKILELEEEVKALKETLRINGELEKRGNYYFLKGESGDKAGPYCTTCWHDKKSLTPLTKIFGAYACYSSNHSEPIMISTQDPQEFFGTETSNEGPDWE